MLCLFKNSKLSLPYHLLGLAISWGSVIYWLYFTFITKSFLSNMFSGEAMFVDLIFGVPIVLIFAIVIYAFLYWMVKFLVIVLLPHTIIHLQTDSDLSEELDPELGTEYWKKQPEDESKDITKTVTKDKSK